MAPLHVATLTVQRELPKYVGSQKQIAKQKGGGGEEGERQGNKN